MKEEKTKKKFNKKLLLFILPVLAISLVMAAAGYYVIFSDTFNVQKSVIGTGITSDTLSDVYEGDIFSGTTRTLENKAATEREIIVTEDSDLDVEVTYVSTTTLTEKTVNFDLDVWEIPTDAAEVEIQYTLIGDEFTVEVIGPEIPGYVLIYYKDNSDRFNEPAEAILVEGNNFPYLPYNADRNSVEDGTYDYCITNEYKTCHGAKIWYVPLTAINTDNTLDWSRASEFRYETELVQYNVNGEITIYPGQILDLIPVYSVQKYAEGEKTITTTVA